MEKNNRLYPNIPSLQEKISSGACCAICNRELPNTNRDSVVLQAESGKKIRVCYKHIVDAAEKTKLMVPVVPRDISKFNSEHFFHGIKKWREGVPSGNTPIDDLINRSPISRFLKDK